MPDYTKWPLTTDLDLVMAVNNIPVRAATTIAFKQMIIDSVASKLTQVTHRQFQPGSAGEVRYFDGSGTGRQIVDAIISFTSVQILGYLGTGGIDLTMIVQAVHKTYPCEELLIYRGSLPGIGRVWLDVFPGGRQNIQVTGTWGYGATIPVAIWEAVLNESAARLAAQTLYNPQGRIVQWNELDTGEKRDIRLPGEVNAWHKQFKEVCFDFRKSLQKQLELGRPRMV